MECTRLTAIALALCGGIAIAIQSIINSALGRGIGNIEGTFVSFVVGGLAAGLLTLLVGTGDILLVTKISPVLLVGGFLGVIVVFATLSSVQSLGTVGALTLSIVGQLLTAVVIDHFGLFGSAKFSLDWPRALGILLLIVAAKLIIK